MWLSWQQTDRADVSSLHIAKFDRNAQTWGTPRVVATGKDWFINWADFPALAIEPNGRLTAVWFINNPVTDASGATAHHSSYQAWLSQSSDDGATWTKPMRLTEESDSVEFVSLQPLAGGGVLAVWLDGRAKHSGHAKAQQLYGRIIGRDTTDTLIDDSVCDCCQTTLTAFPNGDALVAYRARREGEIRDIHTALLRNGHWRSPRILSADEWQINGCPVNGPQLDSQAGQVSAVWFTAADGAPRVYASASPDAGARFLMPQRIDLGHPIGRVDTVQLRDGARIVVWLESGEGNQAGIWLRYISPSDEIGAPVLLAGTSQARSAGFPRIALLKDYDATPAQLLLTYTDAINQNTQVETQLVTLPDLSSLAGRAPCLPCDENDAAASRGYGVKGIVTDWPELDEVTLKFEEIPGVMRRGSLTFKVEPGQQTSLPVGQELLGRIEQRDSTWWLFHVTRLTERHE